LTDSSLYIADQVSGLRGALVEREKLALRAMP
jgi:hypothetical protein